MTSKKSKKSQFRQLMNGQVRVDKLSEHEEHVSMAAEPKKDYK